MNTLDFGKSNPNSDNRTELEIMMESKPRIIEAIKSNPAVATQFLKDIGLLDADGNRVRLPGEADGARMEVGATPTGQYQQGEYQQGEYHETTNFG